MSQARGYSLKWRLARRLIALQGVGLAMLIMLLIGALYVSGHIFNFESEDITIDALKRAVTRNVDGALALRKTPALSKLREDVPDLWFVVRDRQGHRLVEGAPPSYFATIGDALDDIGQARLGWNLGDPPRVNAIVRWVRGDAGELQITTGPGAKAPLSWLAYAVTIVFATFASPIFLIMGAATAIATPMIVRRALSGLGSIADEAGQIDIERRGGRLSTDRTPSEVTPLVNAFNQALQRLDDGHARDKRFLADAAHELRTPIAILQTRLDALPDGPMRTRLLQDVARLSVLAEQLLDVHRLDHQAPDFALVDLVAAARRVAADMAPLAIAAGYRLSFDADCERVMVRGDQAALERALANLTQNAIEHGGRSGEIGIAIRRDGSIEVADEGPGVPTHERERIFEPFHRLQPRDRGAGLGLHLVREIVERHHGQIAVSSSRSGGALFRIALPLSAGV